MTMISAICIVDFDVEEFDTAAIAKLLEAISHAESVPRINLGGSTPIPIKAGWPGPLVRGDVASVAGWLDASDGQPGWWCATIDVTGLHAPAVYVGLVEKLFDCRVNPWVRARPPHGDSAVVEIQKRTTALAGVEDGTHAPPLGPSIPCVRARGGGIVDGGSGRALWDVPRDELMRELGQASSERALFTLSGPFSVTLPDGSKLRQFLGGGSMAVGHTIAQIVGSASLGFHDTEELGAWLSDVGGEPTEPSFSTFAWQYADRPLDPDGRLTVRVPQQRSFADAVRLASSIVRGKESETEELVGLRVHLAGQTCLDKPIFLHELTASELAAASESVTRDALDLLVTACGLIAASRVPKDKRVAAATTLAYLGPPRADKVIASLRKADGDVDWRQLFLQVRDNYSCRSRPWFEGLPRRPRGGSSGWGSWVA